MATVSRGLPKQPHLDVPKRQARELLRQWQAKSAGALERVRRRHPEFRAATTVLAFDTPFRLSDAQLVVAREYAFANWAELKQRINANSAAQALDAAIRTGDCDAVTQILGAHPTLLHIPVVSGNWGPPLSHAANLGRLKVMETVAALGGRDHQHAFDRAILQGQIECARWLLSHGAKLEPGIVMGACETLNPAGLQFLADMKAPFTDAQGDRLAPLARALGTYSRNPARKHATLEIFARQGYDFPDTPIMALHRGRVDLLKNHLRRDAKLINRCFSCHDIYPPEFGFTPAESCGMHGTPIHGTTLLHLTVDFCEREIFDLLLAEGADANARALVDEDGFGGHTPLYHALVGRSSPGMAEALLAQGASGEVRASLRKFLDWEDQPRWHVARDVTPAEWARGFPLKDWVNAEALGLVESR